MYVRGEEEIPEARQTGMGSEKEMLDKVDERRIRIEA